MSPQIVQGGFAIVRFYFVTKIYYVPQNSAIFFTSLYLVLNCTVVHDLNDHVYCVRTYCGVLYLFFWFFPIMNVCFPEQFHGRSITRHCLKKCYWHLFFRKIKKGTKPMSCMV